MSAEQTPRPKPSKRPRYRYILFRIEGTAPDRNTMIKTIQSAAAPELGAWLTRYEDGRGILRVLRGREKAGQDVLQRLPGVQTVSTSGTIAALERSDRHGRRGQGRQH